MRRMLCVAVSILVRGTIGLSAWAQAPVVQPVPIPGGDVISPVGLVNQFFPGVGSIYDGMAAEPHGITNFRGVVAMGYTSGLVTDNSGNTYQVIMDIRVYQGDYIGAQATYNAGGSTSAKAHGTFVEI